MRKPVFLAAAVAVSHAAAAAPPADDETTAFRCRTGVHELTVVRSGTVLAYRSDVRGGLELQLVGGHVARAAFSGGGELQAVFANGPWTYVVFERTVRTGFSRGSDPSFDAGVAVLRGRRTVVTRQCDDPDAQFTPGALEGLPQGEYREH